MGQFAVWRVRRMGVHGEFPADHPTYHPTRGDAAGYVRLNAPGARTLDCSPDGEMFHDPAGFTWLLERIRLRDGYGRILEEIA